MGLATDRSVLAGMGVAGMLVMTAAVAFIFAGTLFSFHAWPQLTGSAGSRPLIVATEVAKPRAVARIVAGPAAAPAPARRVPTAGPPTATPPAPTATRPGSTPAPTPPSPAFS